MPFALPRYSEDLDFTLEGDPSRYALRRHLQVELVTKANAPGLLA